MIPWAAAVVPAAGFVLGAAVAWGALLARVRELERRRAEDRVLVERLALKLEALDGGRLLRAEAEVQRLRDWRHLVESSRFGRRLLGLDRDDDP